MFTSDEIIEMVRNLTRAAGHTPRRARLVSDYPETVNEVINDNLKFKKGAIAALRRFKAKKTFKLSDAKRFKALKTLIHELADVYEIARPTVLRGRVPSAAEMRTERASSGDSYYSPAEHKIVLNGRLSIITALHEFGHARGKGERGACKFSLNLFKRVYPKQFAKLAHNGHTAVMNG
jgi:hypothetical protein